MSEKSRKRNVATLQNFGEELQRQGCFDLTGSYLKNPAARALNSRECTENGGKTQFGMNYFGTGMSGMRTWLWGTVYNWKAVFYFPRAFDGKQFAN
jgi:hypothetical protein